MMHRIAGRRLDRHSQERVALFRNMTISLFDSFGTKREYILTTVAKAKEARRFAERIITLGIKARVELDAAAKAAGVASADELRKLHSESKKRFGRSRPDHVERPDFDKKQAAETAKRFQGRTKSDFPEEVRKHVAKSIHYRRLVIERLRHEPAVRKLIDKIAPAYIKRVEENPAAKGGYTRVLKTSQWTLGDGSTKALWGFVVKGEGEANAAAPADAKKATVGAK
jgi:large subunit ribosomal protein L17